MWNTAILSALALSILASGSMAVAKYAVARDYIVVASVTCDPQRESCFIGDGENTPEFYKVIEKNAHSIPACDGWSDQCEELSCSDDDPNCEEYQCEDGECYGAAATES